MDEFIARENIKRFKSQLRGSTDAAQQVTLRKLLQEEQDHLAAIRAEGPADA
jgi:hypothetical protein